MQSKKARHNKILQIIKERNIDKQEDIVQYLRNEGFDVTQATISRDIRDLRLVKETSHDGTPYYTQSDKETGHVLTKKLKEIFSHSVSDVDFAVNIVVVKTISGMAQGAAAAIDAMNFTEIVGSIAGDDTIMLVTRSENDAEYICNKLNETRG